jgi:ribosome-binding protein aMBF1 (putative translation factor)
VLGVEKENISSCEKCNNYGMKKKTKPSTPRYLTKIPNHK